MQIRIQEVNDEEIKPVPEMKAGTEDQKKLFFFLNKKKFRDRS